MTVIELNYAEMHGYRAEDFEEVMPRVRESLMPRPGRDYKVFLGPEPELREGESLIEYTLSLCPQCLSLVRAVVFEREGKVLIRKRCPDHGEFEEVYWGDARLYRKFRRWQYDGRGVSEPVLSASFFCPFNCGLCVRHKSHPSLVNLVATNRCDLSCWYCFFFAERAGYVYEPTLEHVRYMLKVARSLRPVSAKALQITGGEPLLRDDIVDLVRLAKEEGFTHVQVNTDGIRLAFEPELATELREAGTNVLYLSFDGVRPSTNPKNHWEIPYILESCRRARMGIVLVPTVIRGYNDHELGDMIRFALRHIDVVRGVNFQPVSITGRVPRAEREVLRITIPDAIIKIEEQTEGQISRDDWYPVPFVVPISHFVEAMTRKPQVAFTTHFACGAATYVFKDGDRMVPITRFIDVERLFERIEELSQVLSRGANKYVTLLRLLRALDSCVDWSKVPSCLGGRGRVVRLLFNIFVRHNYEALGEFHYKTLFLGMMHFMDLYNHDISRVQRCCIHYITPDGRLIPFCTFNVIPELYRDRIQRAFGIPIRKWEELTGKRLVDCKYRRNVRKLVEGDAYRRCYEGFVDFSAISVEEHVAISRKFGVPTS